MRPIWNGSISFGLVNIPINLYSGSTTHEGLDLDMLHKKDNSPIRYARICREDGKEIAFEDIAKGYQYKKGSYVVLDKEDFKKANVRKTNTLDIKQFTSEDEIDIRYYAKPYYLEPEKGGEKAYGLLREALERSGKVALCKYVLHEREDLGVIKPVGKALVLTQMRWPADLRTATELKFPGRQEFEEQEIKMAMAIINQDSRHFIPEDWHDTYTEELEKIIQAKVKGEQPKVKGQQPKTTHVKDLMATLKASLRKTKK